MGLFGDDTPFRAAHQNEPTGWTSYSDEIDKFGRMGFGNGYSNADAQGNGSLHNSQGQTISNKTLQNITGQDLNAQNAYSGNPVFGGDDQFYHKNFDILAANAPAMENGDYSKLQQDTFNRQYLIDPMTAQNDPSKQYFAGNAHYASAENDMLNKQAFAAQGMQAPTIDTSGMAPWQMGAQGAFTNMGAAAGNMNAQGAALNGVATGAGFQGQMNSAQALQALGQMPAGPSVAEQAMRMQSAQNEHTQAALAAGARGGNSALALNNAAGNAAGMGGQLTQQLGLQRAQEDMANRQFSANALGAAGQAYGQAAGTQMNAYGGASQAYGNAGSIYGQGGALALQGAGQMGQIATANANNVLQGRQINNAYGLGSQQLGADYMKAQLNASAQADANRTQNATNAAGNRYANRDRSSEGTITGSAGGDKVLGAGASALGAMAPLSDIRAKKDVSPASQDVSNVFRAVGQSFSPTVDNVVAPRGQMVAPQVSQQIDYSGPAASNAADVRMALQQHPLDSNMLASKDAIWPGSRAQLYGMGMSMPGVDRSDAYGLAPNPYTTSDIRAKKDIAPAANAVDAAYRQGDVVRGTNVQYPMSVGRMPDAPAYSYEYKHPNAPGAAGGMHYGPMAQDLEKTPAGASVVVNKPGGMKGIDTSRLSLLNTSELSKQRAELDALKASMPAQIMGPQVAYPTPQAYRYQMGM